MLSRIAGTPCPHTLSPHLVSYTLSKAKEQANVPASRSLYMRTGDRGLRGYLESAWVANVPPGTAGALKPSLKPTGTHTPPLTLPLSTRMGRMRRRGHRGSGCGRGRGRGCGNKVWFPDHSNCLLPLPLPCPLSPVHCLLSPVSSHPPVPNHPRPPPRHRLTVQQPLVLVLVLVLEPGTAGTAVPTGGYRPNFPTPPCVWRG